MDLNDLYTNAPLYEIKAHLEVEEAKQEVTNARFSVNNLFSDPNEAVVAAARSQVILAAEQLGEKAYRLECAGDQGDIETAASLFDDLKDELERVISFLSRADWIEAAKQGVNSRIKKKSIG